MKLSFWRRDLQITSRETALEFYGCIHQVHLIAVDRETFIRIEPGCHISRIPRSSVIDGTAPFYPSMYDPYGTLHINGASLSMHGFGGDQMGFKENRSLKRLLVDLCVVFSVICVPVWLFMIALITGNRWIIAGLLLWVLVCYFVARRFDHE